MSGLWILAALASSLLSAQNVEMNRRARQEGFRLNLWRMALSAVFWLPLALLQQQWPTNPLFYIVAAASGIAMIAGFTIQNDLALKHNGRVAILHMPLKAMLVFLVWMAVSSTARSHLLENPLHVLGVVISLAIMVAALYTFRRHDVSWSSFKAILPIVALYGAGDILVRLTLDPTVLSEQLIIFLFVLSATSAVVSGLLLPWRPQPELPLLTPSLVRAGGWAAFGSAMNQVCFFIALVTGPSPAYVSMVALLAPVWLLAYHRFAGVRDDASPVAGTIVVLAAILLMVCAA